MLRVNEIALAEVKKALPEIDLIEDAALREKVARIWAYAWGESKWKNLCDACFECGMPQYSLMGHVRVTALGAVAMAKYIQEIQGITICRETVLISALLHDVSKLVEYEPKDDGSGAQISDLGKKLQHAVYGAHLMMEEEMSIDLVHAVVSHTPQSNIRPFLLEAIVMQYLDHADARVLFNHVYGGNMKFPALK